jgi:hypothetical protein
MPHPSAELFAVRARSRALAGLVAGLALAAPLVSGCDRDEGDPSTSEIKQALTAPNWAPNVNYALGALVTYNNIVYECRLAHRSQTGWEPTIAQNLWQRPTPTGILPWTTQTHYVVRSGVTFEGGTYECRQEHVSISSWTPKAAPSLWRCASRSCGGGSCSGLPNGSLCDDGNACTVNDTCSSGTCRGTTKSCPAGNACQNTTCNTTTGACGLTPKPAGTSCSDGNVCNGAESCNSSGSCLAGTPPSCDDGNVCTTDSCAPASGCQHVPHQNGPTCNPNNQPPVAAQGPDRDVVAGAAVTLDGSASWDPDADPITYSWTITRAPAGSTAALTGADTATPSLTPDLPGEYAVRLTVSDGAASGQYTFIVSALELAFSHDDMCVQDAFFPNPGWIGQTPWPGVARLEREFKYGFRGPAAGSVGANAIAQSVAARLATAISQDSLWQAPQRVTMSGQPLRRYQQRVNDNGNIVTNTGFLDIYFDTANGLNYLYDGAHRFRRRFDNPGEVFQYLGGADIPSTRAESMTKVGRRLLEPGFSVVTETRFEALEQLPASQIDRILCDFESGTALLTATRRPTNAAKALSDYFIDHELTAEGQLAVAANMVVVTERRRQHMRLPMSTTGEYADAFIITVDRSSIFEAGPMVAYMRDPSANPLPTARGSFLEVEVEFERNSSPIFDLPSLTPEQQALKAAIQADQRTIMQLIQEAAAMVTNAPLQPETRSKYTQGYELLFNVAQGKTARQSSTFDGAAASRAVDGNTNGDYAAGSVSHTEATGQPFWEVDLGQSQFVSGVEISNRTDCCGERLTDFYVIVSPTALPDGLSQALATPGAKATYFSGTAGATVRPLIYASGRYVRVQLRGMESLQLAEVKVFGHAPTPAPLVVNRAFGKSATQSSTELGAVAARAVDGFTSGNFAGDSVTHTSSSGADVWDVDLGRDRFVSQVELWNRSDCCSERLNNYYVFVSPTPLPGNSLAAMGDLEQYAYSYSPGVAAHHQRTGFHAKGRYVRVALSGPARSGSVPLSLAEVKVFGAGPFSCGGIIVADDCVACPGNKIPVDNQCVCPLGGSDPDGDDICECEGDMEIIDGRCDCRNGATPGPGGECRLCRCEDELMKCATDCANDPHRELCICLCQNQASCGALVCQPPQICTP